MEDSEYDKLKLQEVHSAWSRLH